MAPPVDTLGSSHSIKDAVKYYLFSHIGHNNASSLPRKVTASDVGQGGIVLATKHDSVSIGVDKKILALHCPLIRYLEHAALCGNDDTPKSEMFAAGTVVQFQLPHSNTLNDVMNFLSVVFRKR